MRNEAIGLFLSRAQTNQAAGKYSKVRNNYVSQSRVDSFNLGQSATL